MDPNFIPMDAVLAQQFLEIASFFLKNKTENNYKGYTRQLFSNQIFTLLEVNELDQAITKLQGIINGEIQAPSVPENMPQLLENLEKAQAGEKESRDKAIAQTEAAIQQYKNRAAFLNRYKIAGEAPKVKKAQGISLDKLNSEVEEVVKISLVKLEPDLKDDPKRLDQASKEVVNIIIASQITEQEIKTEQVWKNIDTALQEHGVALGDNNGKVFSNYVIKETQPQTQTLKTVFEAPLPPEVVQRLSTQTEGIAFSPLYAVMQPKTGAAYLKKAVVALPVKILASSSENYSPEWQEIFKGVTAENIQATIDELKVAGLPENHPRIIQLQNKYDRIYREQKNEKGEDKPIVKLLKAYYSSSELTGKPLRTDGFVLKRQTVWKDNSGYSFRLKQAFNWIGTKTGLYERIPALNYKSYIQGRLLKGVTGGKFNSFRSIGTAIYRKTGGKIMASLGKTAVGQGVKKAITWGATKLGVKAITTAITTALGTVAPGVGNVVGFVVGVVAGEVIDKIYNKVLKPIISFIKKNIKDPQKALFFIIAGAGVVGFFPAAAVVGFTLIGMGAIGLLAGGTVAGAIGGFGAGVVGFFAALTTISFATPVGLFVVIVLVTIFVLTLFIITVVSGAFILPVNPQKIAPSQSAYISVTKTASQMTFTNDELAANPKITYTLTVMAKSKPLTNVRIQDITKVSKDGTAPTIPDQVWEESTIDSSWTKTYEIQLNDQFRDSLIMNTVNVSAEADGSHQVASASLTVVVGNPPEDCPSGWPVDPGYWLTQGPNNSYSHYGSQAEAIDIGTPLSTPVKATHTGVIRFGSYSNAGSYVEIIGRCNNIDIATMYLSFSGGRITVSEGQTVHRGEQIGLIGTHGDGPHLHYMFKLGTIPMAPPYIPANVPGRCDNCMNTTP